MGGLIRVRRRMGLISLSLLFFLAMIVSLGWMLFSPETAAVKRIFALFGLVFLTLFFAMLVREIVRGKNLLIGPKGFGFAEKENDPKLIPWDDVERLFVAKIGGSKAVMVRLRSYENYLSQFSDAEAADAVRSYNAIVSVGRGASVLGFAAGEFPMELAWHSAISPHVRALADALAASRHIHGAEIYLSWGARDRGPEAFIALMESYRRNS